MFSKLKSFLFKNKTDKQTVAKNSIWLAISNFGGRLVKAAVVIYAARTLGTAGYGVFSYAITLSAFLALFMDPGVNNIFMREASRSDAEEQQTIFSTAFVMKLVLLILGAIIVLVVAPTFSTLPGARAILPIVAVILAFDTIRDFFTTLLRAQERMEWDAGIFITTNLGILVFGFAFLAMQKTPEALAWAYVVGDVFGIALATWIIRPYLKKILAYVDPRRILPILNAAWPFAITSALGVLLTSADILIISWMRSASEVGIYSAGIRIVQVLYLLPAVFQFSTLPLFARLANKDGPRFRSALERIVKIILAAAIPLAIGGAILGTAIMRFVFGAAYASGGPAFSILMVGLLFDFPVAVIGNAVFAWNHQKSLIVNSAIAGVANVVFDLIFIPHWGVTGSAIATLIAQILSNWYLWHSMKKINYFEVVPKLGKAVLAGIVMAISVAALFFAHVNVVVNIACGGMIYFAMLYILREPLLIEIKQMLVGAAAETT